MKKLIVIFIAILAISSCQSSQTEQTPAAANQWQTVKVGNKYSLSLPSYLSKTTQLLEGASLQYMNTVKEFYVIVLEESRADVHKAISDNDLTSTYSLNLKGYADLLCDGMESKMENFKKTKITDTTINNLPAKLTTITGKVSDIDIFYSLAMIQGKTHYYQILSWTLANRANTHKGDMTKIFLSFKEL